MMTPAPTERGGASSERRSLLHAQLLAHSSVGKRIQAPLLPIQKTLKLPKPNSIVQATSDATFLLPPHCGRRNCQLLLDRTEPPYPLPFPATERSRDDSCYNRAPAAALAARGST